MSLSHFPVLTCVLFLFNSLHNGLAKTITFGEEIILLLQFKLACEAATEAQKDDDNELYGNGLSLLLFIYHTGMKEFK